MSPMETLQSGRHTDAQNRVRALALEVAVAFWGRSGWHREQAGLSGGTERERERDLTHTHTILSAPILLRSKRRLAGSAAPEKLPLSGDGFHVNGGFNRRCVTSLPAHRVPSDPLLLVFN